MNLQPDSKSYRTVKVETDSVGCREDTTISNTKQFVIYILYVKVNSRSGLLPQ